MDLSTSTSETTAFFYGWDLLYRTVHRDINKKSDFLIVLIHFLLTKHYSFRCVGIGDDKTLLENEKGSELLPDNWNGDNTKYSMRYVHNKTLYLLLGHITEDALIINLLDVNSKNVSNICIEPNLLVVEHTGNITTIMPTASEIVDRLRKELLDPVFTGNSREATTQTTVAQTVTQTNDPLRIGEPRQPGRFMPNSFEPRPFGFPDVGRGDLDPLARGGPGNLFQFPSHPNAPGGFPQPRFDPFGPPDPNVPGHRPNPDHLRPPNWNPDYYM